MDLMMNNDSNTNYGQLVQVSLHGDDKIADILTR